MSGKIYFIFKHGKNSILTNDGLVGIRCRLNLAISRNLIDGNSAKKFYGKMMYFSEKSIDIEKLLNGVMEKGNINREEFDKIRETMLEPLRIECGIRKN